MTALNPLTDEALKQPVATVVGLVEIDFPGYALRLVDGAGVLTYNGTTYYGSDPTFGSLFSIDEISDGAGEEVPAISLILSPASDEAAATLARADMQGSLCRLKIAVINPDTGTVVGEPHLLFAGEVDVPTLRFDKGSYEVEYEIVSALERLFNRYDGARLTPGFHKSIWPGEAGFDQVTGVTQFIYWGKEKQSGVRSAGSAAKTQTRRMLA